MKKFKLFVLALFAMLSTNAFAAVGDDDANTIFRFKIAKEYVASPEAVGSAMITGFVAGYEGYATTKIPAVIEGATSKGKYKVVGIAANAFEGYAITTLDLTEAENLGDATLVAAADVATYVGIFADAFKGTSIATLDLSATKISTVNQWFETTNKKVTTVKLPTTVTTIAVSAFEGLSALNSVTFAEQTAPAVYGLTINADAFKNTMKLKTLTLPANVTSIAAGAFEKTYLETLTINGALAATSVASGAFVKNGSQKLTFTYAPAETAEVNNAIAQDAFGAAGDDVWVTFKTTTHYGNALAGYATYVADAKGNKFYGAELDFTPTALSTITVYNNGGSYAYAGYTVNGTTYPNGIKIAKKQGENKDINVMVYGAYFDNIGGKGKNSAVMMDQLHLIGGYYWIPGGTNVIVKSSSDAGVEFEAMTATEAAANDSRHKDFISGNDQNEIKVFNAASGLADGEYATNVIDWYNTVVPGTTLYFLRDLEGGKEFGWKQREDDSVIKYGQLFLPFVGTAAARIDVIWLDGSEEDATAIKAVKTAAEKGAIYNLAGQKVNAAYKGVVIKDGKKYIQK
jgi:hypothetical protein